MVAAGSCARPDTGGREGVSGVWRMLLSRVDGTQAPGKRELSVKAGEEVDRGKALHWRRKLPDLGGLFVCLGKTLEGRAAHCLLPALPFHE